MSRLLRTAAHAHVASSVIGRNQRRQALRWAEQSQPAAAAAPPAAAPAPQDMDAKLAQLKQLGELRDAGILTDAEFDAKKALILG
jgi:membrane protease subunit (stomatin/prohibitin family)